MGHRGRDEHKQSAAEEGDDKKKKDKKKETPFEEVIQDYTSTLRDTLYSGMLMERILDIELRGGTGESQFTLAEMFSEVRDAIWAELDRGSDSNSYRRTLQRAHLQKLIGLVVKPAADAAEDASTLTRADLKHLKQRIDAAMSGGGLDHYTRAHLDETAARIGAALEAGIQRQMSL